jgi:hypothetical protein
MSPLLSDAHRKMLEQESAITPEVINARDYFTATTERQMLERGFSEDQISIGSLVIPVYNTRGDKVLDQLKSKTPRKNKQGKPVKYETPLNSNMALDVHPLMLHKVKNPKETLWITEGLKKADSLTSRGCCTIGLLGVYNWRGKNELGGKTALAEWENIALNGREVIICFDSDVMTKKQVHKALERLKNFLESRKAKVSLIYLPDAEGGGKQGVDDYFAAGHSLEDLLKFKSSELKAPEPPQIVVNGHIADVGDDIVRHLLELEQNGNPLIYARGDLLVELGKTEGGPKLQERSKPDSLKSLLHDALRPVVTSYDKAGEKLEPKPSAFSANHVSFVQRKANEFPQIHTISDVPLVLPDGTIIHEAGYYAEHGYFLNTDGIHIDFMPVEVALELFISAFNEFSYQAPHAGFTVTMALTLQPFLMPYIDDLTPLFAILGSRRAGSGTGKGFLIDCIYRIHKGKPYTHDGSMPATDEEMGKVLFAALSEGTTHIIFDDVDAIKRRQHMAAITSRFFKGRILGVSQRHEVSTGVTWVVTGNAPDIHRDFYRRMIPIYLGVGMARAWEKQYENPNPHRDILENRNLYLSAAMSIIRNWLDLGKPLSKKLIKGFDRWSAVMGGVLESIGLPHLTDARDGLDELIEVDNSDLDILTAFWAKSELATERIKAKALLSLAHRANVFNELWESRTDEAGAAALAKHIKPYINDVFGKHYLRRKVDDHAKTFTYFLEAVSESTSKLADILKPEVKTTLKDPRTTPADDTTNELAGDARGSLAAVSSADVKSPDCPESPTFKDIPPNETEIAGWQGEA